MSPQRLSNISLKGNCRNDLLMGSHKIKATGPVHFVNHSFVVSRTIYAGYSCQDMKTLSVHDNILKIRYYGCVCPRICPQTARVPPHGWGKKLKSSYKWNLCQEMIIFNMNNQIKWYNEHLYKINWDMPTSHQCIGSMQMGAASESLINVMSKRQKQCMALVGNDNRR